MEENKTHNTHNLTCTSSDDHYNNNKESSSSSSEIEYFEKVQSEKRWSQIIKQNPVPTIDESILNEDEIDITNKSYEEETKNQDKIQIYGRHNRYYQYYKKKGIIKFLDGNFKILDNGIIVKTLKKMKKVSKQPMQVNQFILRREKKNKNVEVIHNSNVSDFFPKIKKSKNDSFHVMYIKRPKRSFITKVCKYKKPNSKRINEMKKMNSSYSARTSLGMASRIQSYSSKLTRMPTIIVQKKQKLKHKPKNSFRNKDSIIDNSENKIFSLSTTSAKKLTVNSNGSFYLTKTNNLIKNNYLKKRPMSSIEIQRNEIDLNVKNTKRDNPDITTCNKDNTLPKTRPISSMMNTQLNKSDRMKGDYSEKTIIYENANFMEQFKELKNAFDVCDNNNYINIQNNNKNNSIEEINNYYNSYVENKKKKKEIKMLRKYKSEKLNKTDYYRNYSKEMASLYNIQNDNFEDEKQNRQNRFCKNCGYIRHFGNEQSCPICVTLNEQNKKREEKLSNKNYYFPFKDKYDDKYSPVRNIFKKNKNCFNNNCLNYFNIKKSKLKSFKNAIYLNNVYNSPNNIRRKLLRNNMTFHEVRKNKSIFFNKYDFIRKYFG